MAPHLSRAALWGANSIACSLLFLRVMPMQPLDHESPEREDPSVEEKRNEEPRDKSGWTQFAKYTEIAFIFPAATVVGLFIGMALDHWLHTTWLSIAGLLVGIFAGFVQLVRLGISSKSD